MIRAGVLVAGGALMLSLGAPADPTAEKFWPQWRGPYATGASKTAEPPIEWRGSKNVRRKVEIPGRGSASPVVWGDKLFVLTAIPAGRTGAASHTPKGAARPRDVHQFVVIALDRATGKVLWQRVARPRGRRVVSPRLEIPVRDSRAVNFTFGSTVRARASSSQAVWAMH